MPNSSFAPAEQQRGEFSLQLRPVPAAVSDLTLLPAHRAPSFTESLARAVAQLEALVQSADAYLISGGEKIESDDFCRELDRARGILVEVLGASA